MRWNDLGPIRDYGPHKSVTHALMPCQGFISVGHMYMEMSKTRPVPLKS